MTYFNFSTPYVLISNKIGLSYVVDRLLQKFNIRILILEM